MYVAGTGRSRGPRQPPARVGLLLHLPWMKSSPGSPPPTSPRRLVLPSPAPLPPPLQPPPGHHGLSLGVIQAAGIFALSSTAHSTLPALRM